MEYITYISSILAVVISCITLYKFFNSPYKQLQDKQSEEIKKAIDEVNIKIQEQQIETKKDLFLLKKLVITMADELETKNHVNGKTEKVLEEVKDELYNS